MRANRVRGASLRWPALLLTLACSGGLPGVHAAVVDLAWDRSIHIERIPSVTPGTFAELCGPLSTGQEVHWSFEGGQALDFNIHYHPGEQVVVPAMQAGAKKAAGRLDVVLAQDYCWMWSNKSDHQTDLRVALRRQ